MILKRQALIKEVFSVQYNDNKFKSMPTPLWVRLQKNFVRSKEEVPMNPSATISLTQMILSWTLLGVLCTWMLFCAFLALRPTPAEKREMADLPTPSGAFPVFVSQSARPQLSPSLARSPNDLVIAPAEATNDVVQLR